MLVPCVPMTNKNLSKTLIAVAVVVLLATAVVHAAVITTITPNQGSLLGWTRVSILGTGFDIRGRSNQVYFGSGIAGVFCDPVPNECTTTRIVCLTPAYQAVGAMPVTVTSFGFNAICNIQGGCTYTYTIQRTPQVTYISPQWMIAPANITVFGTKFSQGDATVAAFDFTMWIGDEERCNLVSTITGSSFICNVQQMRPGLLPTTVIHGASGMAIIDPLVSSVLVVPTVTAITPKVGSLGGGSVVTIYGSSFSPALSDNYVTIHGNPCIVNYYGTSFITCITSPSATETVSSTRQIAANHSYQLDIYTNLPSGYDVDLYFVGTLQYLQPTETHILNDDFSFLYNYGCTQCGYRVTAQFIPTATGNWTFSTYGDDNWEIWLGADSNPVERKRAPSSTGSPRALNIDVFNPRRITSSTTCCYYANSAPQYLVAGQSYWFRAFVKNGGGPGALWGNVIFNGTSRPLTNYLYYSADYESPVKVTVADTPVVASASCYNFSSCDFNYVAAATPVVTSVQPSVVVPLQSLTIAGSGFDVSTSAPATSLNTVCATSQQCGNGGCSCTSQALCTLLSPTCAWQNNQCGYASQPPQCFQWSLNTIMVGDQPCNVTSQTATSLVCNVPFLPAGFHRVSVSSGRNGQATSVHYVTVDTTIQGFTPSSGSINGGNVLTIVGSGFNMGGNATRVTVGSDPCDIVSVDSGMILCRVPGGGVDGSTATITVYTRKDRSYVLPTSYQYDAKPVRPGTTTVVTEANIRPITGPAIGNTFVYITLPSEVTLASDVSIVIGGVVCTTRAYGKNRAQCATGATQRTGTFASYISYTDKYGQGFSVTLPMFTYYHSVQWVQPTVISPYGGSAFSFSLDTPFSQNELSVSVGGAPCLGFSVRGTTAQCITSGLPPTLPPRPVLANFDFLGDGDSMTNPLNPYTYSAGITVDSNGIAFVPAGMYLMTKKQFTRPFSFKAYIKPTLPGVSFNTIDRSVITRVCVSQPTLSSDGYRGLAGNANNSFYLLGAGNSASGINAINPNFASAALDTTSFQEHRIEVWNTNVRYYVNNVLIYTMYDPSLTTGSVGVGFSAQGVSVRGFTVESLALESFQANVSGVPIGAPFDVFYQTSNVPTTLGVVVDANNVISLQKPTNLDTSCGLYVVASSSASMDARSRPMCPTLFTTSNPVSGALTYKCKPLLPAGTYSVVLANSYYGAGPGVFDVTIALLATNVLPSTIPTSGGRITIFGSGFSAAVSVTVGGVSTPVVNFNSTLVVVDAPSVSSAATASVAITDGVTLLTLSVTYVASTTLNVTAVTPRQVYRYRTVTVTATGFSNGVIARLGGIDQIILSVSSSSVQFRTDYLAAGFIGNMTLLLIQPGVGTVNTTLEVIPVVYGYATPSTVSAAGGTVIEVPARGEYFSMATPIAVYSTVFVNGLGNWTTSNPFDAPTRNDQCHIAALGPFAAQTQVSRTFTSLPVHQYVRVKMRYAVPNNWWYEGLIVNGIQVPMNIMQCDSSASCTAMACHGEASVILRHSGSSLPVTVASYAYISFFLVDASVEVFTDLPYLVNFTGVTAPVDMINRDVIRFTLPAGLALGRNTFSLTIDGVERCTTYYCAVTVVSAPVLTHASVVAFDSATVAPQFVPRLGANVTYSSAGTTISGGSASTDTMFSTQRIHSGDATIVRFSATVVTPGVAFSLDLVNPVKGVLFGVYSVTGDTRIYAHAFSNWYYSGPLLNPGDVVTVEYDTTTESTRYLCNGLRFASVIQRIYWPLSLAYGGTAILANVAVQTDVTEERLVLFGANFTQQPLGVWDRNVKVSINGTNCRSVFVTNGHISCYTMAGTYRAGDVLAVDFSTTLGAGVSTVLQVQPHISSFSPISGGSHGGVSIAVSGGLIADAALNFCAVSSVNGSTATCVSTASASGTAAVAATSNGVSSFTVNSTALSVAFPSVFADVNFTVVDGPTISNVELHGATLHVYGASFASDVAVVLSSGTCAITSSTLNSTYLECGIASVSAGSVDTSLFSATVGVSNTVPFANVFALMSATPSSVGVGGFVEIVVQGSGFGADGDGEDMSVQVNGVSICRKVYRFDSFFVCVTLPGAFSGVLNVTLGSRNIASSFTVEATSTNTPPTVTSVTPASGSGAKTLTIVGTGLSAATSVILGDEQQCSITSQSATQILCTIPSDFPGGRFVVHVIDSLVGSSIDDVAYTGILQLNTVRPGQGPKMGGQLVTVYGTGFSLTGQDIYLGSSRCNPASVSSGYVTCYSTPLVDEFTSDFDITVFVPDSSEDATSLGSSSVYTFSSALTATVSSISPTVGSAAGMEIVTIQGTGFGTIAADVSVMLGTADCRIESITDTIILCRTTPTAPVDNAPVTVLLASEGAATNSGVQFSFKFAITGILGPSQYSVEGGAAITFVGEGFWTFEAADWQSSYFNITLDGWLNCPITSSSWDAVVCTLPPSPRVHVRIPQLSPRYILPPNASLSVVLWGNEIAATVDASVRVVYHESATPVITNVTTSLGYTGDSKIYFGTTLTIVGRGFGASGNRVFINGAACAVQSQSQTRIVCAATTSGTYGPGLVQVLTPMLGYASTLHTCENGFLSCNGVCLTDPMCRYDAWGTRTCASLVPLVASDTFCQANGGADSMNKPFLTDSGSSYDLNCPMYSCEGGDCNTTLSIGGHGAVVSSCGSDPNGFVFDFRSTVTSITGGPVSSIAGGLSVTIQGNALPTIDQATVLFANVLCTVVSASASQIVCITGAATADATGSVAVYSSGYLAQCASAVCGGFSYATASSPSVSSATYAMTAIGATPTLTLAGTLLGTDPTAVTVSVGGIDCPVTQAATTSLVCTPSLAIPAGMQTLLITFSSIGYAAGITTSTIPLSVLGFAPLNGSMAGGTLLTIYGTGFANTSTVSIGTACPATITSMDRANGIIYATTSACSGSTNKVRVRTTTYVGISTANFVQTSTFTPVITGSVSSNLFTLSLTNIGTAGAGDISIYVDPTYATCVLQSISLPSLTCQMDSGYTAGSYNITVYVNPRGYAQINTANLYAVYGLAVAAVDVTSGYLGGNQVITLSGSGFGIVASAVSVSIGSSPCTITNTANTELTCVTGPAPTAGTYAVSVTVCPTNAAVCASAATFNSYEYLANSPTITSVTPTRGSTAGGTRLTISGTSLTSSMSVIIAGVTCTASATEIAATDASGGHTLFCTTAAYQPMYSPVAIRVVAPSNAGDAANNNSAVTYQYIDLWSRWTTWGNSPPPQFGFSAVISEGQVVMIDYSPPRFYLVVVMGTVLFDNTTDIFLECTYIMINYGRFIIGTPDYPFTKRATIRLWGDRLTPEIPVHGSKVIALRYGAIDMHGIPRHPTWTNVTATARAGVTQLYVTGPVDWMPGEFIVIAPTDFDPMEGEVRMLTAVLNGNTNNVTLVLEAPLLYTHFGERQCFGPNNTLCVDEIAEVGLLSRNIVIEGEPNSMNLGFGGTMFLMPMGANGDMFCRLSYIEVRNCGQQYIVGRYPVHYHVTGTIQNSYVNGTSVHDSLNRAFSIHGTSNNTYVNNVAFNVQGHAFFIEDGSERYNIIRNNLVIQVLATTSNLNSDMTPAAIWVTAPMNFVDYNHVAGSQTFGIWYAPFDPSSTGPSGAVTDCPYRQALGSNIGNVAHSNLWHGFHVFKFWLPLQRECDSSSPVAPAVIRNLVTYKNQIWGCAMGNLEIGRIGAVTVDNLTSADNGFQNADGAAYWIEHMIAPNQTVGLTNSLLIAVTNNNPYRRPTNRRGVNLPQDDNFFVENVTFVNYDGENHGFEPQAWAHFKSLCFPYGWEAVVRGLRWVNSPNRVLFRFQHHGIINDDDGTLSGLAGSQVVPDSPINHAPVCNTYSYSAPYAGLVCPNSYKIRRFGVSTSDTPQLDQIWRIENRTEVNPVIDRAYVFTAPINKLINISFLSLNTPNFGWQFGGKTFMQPTEKALFTAFFRQLPYSVYTNWNGGPFNTMYTGPFPTLDTNVSGFAFDNETGRLVVAVVKPQTSFWSVSSPCPPGGCPVPESSIVWNQKCYHVSDAAGWASTSAPTSTTDATIPATVHICLGYNATIGASAHRSMEEQSVTRTCTATNRITTYNFASLTVFGAITLTNDQCPCQGGTIVINIVKYIYIVGGGFVLGNETHPITDCTVQINMLTPPWDAANIGTYKNSFYGFRTFTVQSGLFEIHAAKPRPLYARLSAKALAGSTSLVLDASVGWSVGDAIAIAGTNRQAKYTGAANRVDQSEYNYIAAISADGLTLTLQNALQFDHYGAAPQVLNGQTHSVGAEVAVLTRRVQFLGDTAISGVPRFNAGWKLIIGCTPQNKDGCTYQASMNSVAWGAVKVEGVLFMDIGQSSEDDGAINLDGLTDGTGAAASYFRYNAFWKAYNTPLYIRDTTVGIEISNNVIYDMWDDGIRVESAGNNITGNLAIRMQNSDPLCSPPAYNIFWSCRAAMFRIHAGNLVMDNVAASGIAAGFLTEGDFCDSQDMWSANVAHSTRDGVLVADAPAEATWHWGTWPSPSTCRRISGVTTYWSGDHGVVMWGVTGNVTLQNFVSVDDQVGTFIMTLQGGQFQSYVPFVNYSNITYSNRWNNNDFQCRPSYLAIPQPCRSTTLNSKFWCEFFTSTVQNSLVGNVGAMETVFISTALGIGPTHGEHKNFWEEVDQYSTISGQAHYSNIHFANYDGMTSCNYRNLAFFQNLHSNDTFHQHTFEKITWSNVAADGKVYFWRTYGEVTAWPTDIRTRTYFLDFNNYIHGAFWPDSPNKQLLLDLDGSFTQTNSPRTSILASETATRTSTFTEVGYNGLAFTGGKLSAARAGCAFNSNMNGFVCDNTHRWLSLNLDSLAADQLTRRAGPIVLCRGDGMVEINGDPHCDGGAIDFSSGPVMKGKTQRSTLDRLSRWRMLAEDQGNYTLSFRGAPPSWIRLQLQDYEYLGKSPLPGIVVNLRYFGENADSRVAVYVNGVRQRCNVGWTDPWSMEPPQQWPSPLNASGTHYMNLYTNGSVMLEDGSFGYKKNVLSLTIRPGDVIDLIQEPIVQVNMQVSMTVDEFFQKKDTFAAALASVLGIDPSRIKFASIVAGTTRRRVGSSVSVTVQIEQDPATVPNPTTGVVSSSGSTPVSSSGGSSTPAGGSTATSSVALASLVTQLAVVAQNTSVIAAAANDPTLIVSSMSSQQVGLVVTRPAIAVSSGNPYIAMNVSDATNSANFNASDVLRLITNWVATNFSAVGSPYNTTAVDGTAAIGNSWTDPLNNVTQCSVLFSYPNNTNSYAALVGLSAALTENNASVLPGYTVVSFGFYSNNYVPDIPSPPTSAPTQAPTSGFLNLLTSPENITKFAIGIGIGVAVVMVIGGGVLFHVLVRSPKLKLQRIYEEKQKLKDFIESNQKKHVPTINTLVGEPIDTSATASMFPTADNLNGENPV